jgi:hypothetical protein
MSASRAVEGICLTTITSEAQAPQPNTAKLINRSFSKSEADEPGGQFERQLTAASSYITGSRQKASAAPSAKRDAARELSGCATRNTALMNAFEPDMYPPMFSPSRA